MLNNKRIVSLGLYFFTIFLSQINIFSQQGIVNNIRREDNRDSIHIGYNFYGDTTKDYDVRFSIKDSLYPSFCFIPKEFKGAKGIGKLPNKRNYIIFHKDQIPDDIFENAKIYYDITASEVFEEINYKDISRISKNIKTLINNGVAVIISVEDSVQLFRDYCSRILGIPFNNIRYEVNRNATEDNLEPIFRKDGWLHNRITDGISDVIVYFAGRCVINEKNHKIYLLPYQVNSANGGISLDELISNFEGFNPKSITVFIESSLTNDITGQPIKGPYFYPNISTNRIRIIMACRGNQTNNSIEEEKMGLFTYEILKGLSGSSDLNRDKNITFKELYEYIKKNVWDYSVQKLKKEQDPILIPNLEIIGEKAEEILINFK